MNLYQPDKARITKIKQLSPTVKLFRLEKESGRFKKNKEDLVFIPGQFFLVGQIGYGESPFGPLSPPHRSDYIEIAVRKTGAVTNYLHSLKEGDEITLRGPYGNGFPLEFIESKDIVMASGGCGIPPISALIEYIAKNREKFKRVYLLYGARNPKEMIIRNMVERWRDKDIKVILTIDKPAPKWGGHVGFVTGLITEIRIDETNAVAVMCGPGPMIDALEKVLRPLGISDRRIFVSMERKMQCGVGKCQHCTTGEKYVCMDGPVFYYDEIDKNYD